MQVPEQVPRDSDRMNGRFLMKGILGKTIQYIKSAGKYIQCAQREFVEKSCPSDLLTQTDIAVHDFLSEKLLRLIPGSAVLSEEGRINTAVSDAEKLWIMDPVDGTLNLIHDYGRAVISVALKTGTETVFGVVYDPGTDECFHAAGGQGAYLNGRRIRVSDRPHNEWLVAQGTSLYSRENAATLFEAARRVFMGCRDLRRCGSAAMEIYMIACARQDAFFEIGLKLWDYAAAELILTEAGGVCSDWNGNKLQPGSTAAFSNSCDHKWFLDTLNG
jgi:myo-inositol-1(or 4)-monophosphatase